MAPWCGTSFMIFAAGKNEVLVVLQVGHRFANRCTCSCFFLVFTWLFCHSSLDVADPGSQDWWCIPCISIAPSNLLKVAMGTAYTWTKCLQIKQLHVSPHHSNPLILKTSVVSKKNPLFQFTFNIYSFPAFFEKTCQDHSSAAKDADMCMHHLCREKKLRMISKTRILVPFFLAKKFSHQKKNRKFFRETEVS